MRRGLGGPVPDLRVVPDPVEKAHPLVCVAVAGFALVPWWVGLWTIIKWMWR